MSRTVVLVVAALAITALVVWLMRTTPPAVALSNGSYVAPLEPGSTVSLVVSSGGIELIAGEAPEMRIEYVGDPTREPQLRVKSGSKSADVSVQGLPNKTRLLITVPKQTNLNVSMGAGELMIKDIVGDKDVTLYAGRVQVSGESSQYQRAEAKVLAGKINLGPMHLEKGGVFRFADERGSGKNGLNVVVLAGEVLVSE